MSYKCPSCQADNPDAIPKSRLDEEAAKRKTADAALRTAKAEAAMAGNLADKVKELEGSLAEVNASKRSLDRRVELGEVGITDPDVAELVGSKFDALSAKDQAAGLKGYVEGLRADLENAPGVLKPFLAPPADAPKTPPPSGNPQPTPNATPTGEPFSHDAIAKMSLAEYARHREQILKSAAVAPLSPMPDQG